MPDQMTQINFLAIPVAVPHKKAFSHSFTSCEVLIFRKAQCDASIEEKVDADEKGFVY
jgi:hypothetical protein